MKTSKRNKLLGLALTGSFGLLGATNAFAVAGVNISNTATLGYDVGGTAQTVIESSGGAGNSTPGVGNGMATDFMEDRVINFTVTRDGFATPVPGSTQQAVPFLVDNTGNGTHGFLLAGVHNLGAIDPAGSGNSDIFTPTTIETYVDANGNGILDPAEIVASGAYIDTLAPTDPPVRVFVVSDIPLNSRVPNPLVNGDVAVVSLVAHPAETALNGGVTNGAAADAIVIDDNGNFSSGGTFTNGTAVVPDASGSAATVADDPTTMQTVFNDTATTDAVTGATIDANGNVDVNQNAQQSAFSSYTIATAALTVAKTISSGGPSGGALWDPINNAVSPKSIPGAYITYAVTITNTGAANADLTTLTDALAASLDLDPDFVTSAGPGNATGAPGQSFRLTHSNGTVNFCTGDIGDADTDGCSYPGGAGGSISVNINTVMGGAPNATLANGESLTIEFNAIVQ